MKCLGAVLAGGQSRRMGRDKTSLPMEGYGTMADAVVRVLQVVCGEVVVVGMPLNGTTPGHHRVIPDLIPGRGPLGGIESLLATGVAETYLVAGCDQPCLQVDLLRRLADGNAHVARVFSSYASSSVHCLPIYVSANHLSLVRAALQTGEYSIRHFLDSIHHETVPVSPADEWQLTNVNTPEDYRMANTYLLDRNATPR